MNAYPGMKSKIFILIDIAKPWKAIYQKMIEDHGPYLCQLLVSFRSLPDDSSEAVIECAFREIVHFIAYFAGIRARVYPGLKAIVGGILSLHEYDMRSTADTCFTKDDGSGHIMLSSECNTRLTFPPRDVYYHDTRGCQSFCALYAFGAPTLLYTQRHWKLLVENGKRNRILTFPYSKDSNVTPHVKSTLMEPMNENIQKVILICLLATRAPFPNSVKCPVSDESTASPKATVIKDRNFDTVKKPASVCTFSTLIRRDL